VGIKDTIRLVSQKGDMNRRTVGPVIIAAVVIEAIVVGLGGDLWLFPAVVGFVCYVLGFFVGIGVYSYLKKGDDNSLKKLIDEILEDEDSWSIGVIIMLLAGPAILLGMAVALVWHQLLYGLIRRIPGVDWLIDNFDIVADVFKFVIAGVVCLASVTAFGLLVYRLGYQFGWWVFLLWALIIVGVLVALAIAIGLSYALFFEVIEPGIKRWQQWRHAKHPPAPAKPKRRR